MAQQEMQSLAAALACLALLYTFMPRLPRGLPRLLLLLPCLPVFAWVPFSTRPAFLRANFCFSFLWICPSKLLLISWDLSPEYDPSDGFLYFLVATVLPLHVRGKASTSARTKQGSFFPQMLRVSLFVVVLNACQYRESLSEWAIHALYCLLVFFGLELILDVAAKLAFVLLGLETYPHSDNPFLASSLSEFWGRRWNLVASHMLRLTVYAPILRLLSRGQGQDAVKHTSDAKQSLRKGGNDAGTTQVKKKTSSSCKDNIQSRGLQKKSISQQNSSLEHQNLQQESSPDVSNGESGNARKHPMPARALAMLASFLVSGLIHELIFGCINQSRPTWEVTMFFILHGCATVLEGFASRKLPVHWKLPRPLAIFCTLGFVFFSAAWLFMPPITRTGSDVRVIAEFRLVQSVILDLFKRQ